MEYREYDPSRQLAGQIKCFWILEDKEPKSKSEPERILPDGCPEIIFNLASGFRRHHSDRTELQPKSIVVGQMKQFVMIEPTDKVQLFGIRFEPSGLYHLIRQSLNEITNRIESIDSVFSNIGTELEQRINEAATTAQRISIFEKIFQENISARRINQSLASTAAKIISETGGRHSINKLSRTVGASLKQLERQFNREIGLTPKRFSRITRLQTILQSLKKPNPGNWADAAYSFGYFDQAHFIKDFREFAGVTPRAFAKQQKELTDIFIS